MYNGTVVDVHKGWDVVVMGTGLWHVGPTCGLNSTNPLKSIQVKEPATRYESQHFLSCFSISAYS